MDRRSFLKALYGVSVCAVVPALISKPDIPVRTDKTAFGDISREDARLLIDGVGVAGRKVVKYRW